MEIVGGFGSCFNASGAMLCVFALVNGRRSNQMGWVNMVVVMWVFGGGWCKRCRWATSAVMWECSVVVIREASSVGGQGACDVSVLLC